MCVANARACVCVFVSVDDWVQKLNNRTRASGVTHHISAVFFFFSSSAGNLEVQSLRTGKEGETAARARIQDRYVCCGLA